MHLLQAAPTVQPRPRQRRALYVLLSFLLPFIVTLLAAVALRVRPFGDHTLAITDAKFYLNGQMNYARMLRGEEGFLYSLGNGLGGNNWAALAWGAFAPASSLALFAGLESIPSWFTFICAVNIALCGLTMYLLLAGLLGHKSSNLLFSTAYAMMGFNVVNCYQTGFFHGPQLLPLMILGLVYLLRGKAPWLYILSLGSCIFLNFYFGFHLCAISLIAFLAYLYANGPALAGKRKRLFAAWSVSSLIAGLLGAPMWLPALKAFTGGGRLEQTTLSEYTFRENMPFLRMFAKLFTGANSTNELVSGMPNIFCGILVVALVILYFMDRHSDVRRKRTAAVVLGVYLLTFFLPALTILMHGGTHTNWFPFRYSYVFSFLLICIAAEEFERLDTLTLQDTKKCGVILLVSALLIFSSSYEFITGGCVVLDFALLLLMWVGFWLYKTAPEKAPKRTLSIFLILVMCGNLYANFIISTKRVQSWELDLDQYYENILESGALIDGVRLIDDSFFRMEKDESESSSVGADPFLYNYNGVSHSGPTERMFVHKQLNKLGVNWFDMRHWYSKGIPAATDTLLGLKYLISERDLAEEKDYERLTGTEKTSIFRNENALSPAILVNGEATAVELGNDAFENLNAVWKAMTGESQDLFTPQTDVTFTLHSDATDKTFTAEELRTSISRTESVSASGAGKDENEEKTPDAYVEITFTAEHDGPVYYFDTSVPQTASGSPEESISCIGVFKAGDPVSEILPLNGDYANSDTFRYLCSNLSFAYADNDRLAEYAALLNSRDVTFLPEKDSLLTGRFTAEAGQRLLFTIPWDEGWTCFIDGKPVPIDKTWDLFMSVDVPEGSHSYEMRFFPAWMNYGLILGGAALLGLVGYMAVWTARKKKTPAGGAIAAEPGPEAQADPAAPANAAPEQAADETTEVTE